MENVSAVGNVQRFAHVMVGNQDAEAAVFELGDQIADFADGNGVDTGQWLVQQDKIWLAGQSSGDFKAPPLTSGEGDGR